MDKSSTEAPTIVEQGEVWLQRESYFHKLFTQNFSSDILEIAIIAHKFIIAWAVELNWEEKVFYLIAMTLFLGPTYYWFSSAEDPLPLKTLHWSHRGQKQNYVDSSEVPPTQALNKAEITLLVGLEGGASGQAQAALPKKLDKGLPMCMGLFYSLTPNCDSTYFS